MVCVSLTDAEAFAAWLTSEERAKGLIGPGDRYRLPTDAEWSAACGLGKYPWGSAWPPPADAGNFCGSESKTGPANVASWNVIGGFQDAYERTAPVAQFAENKFGLYDMGGNVWEMCSSEYQNTMNSLEIRKHFATLDQNEKSSDGKANRVLRGGSWCDVGHTSLQSSYRYANLPTFRFIFFGFRLVLEVGSGG